MNEFRIIYDTSEVLEWGGGSETNITKKRWAGRWVYQVNSIDLIHKFERLADAKSYMKGVGRIMTRSVEEIIDVASSLCAMNFQHGLFVDLGVDMEFYTKQLHHVRHRIKNRSRIQRGMGFSSDLNRDLRWHSMMIERMKEDVSRIDTIFERRKEVMLRTSIKRINRRVEFIDRDVRRLGVEGWKNVEVRKYGNQMFKVVA